MFELFMYVYPYCNALSARFFAVDRALNSYFMIMIMIMIKELIAIKKINASKNFNAGAITATLKRQLLLQKHIIQCTDR